MSLWDFVLFFLSPQQGKKKRRKREKQQDSSTGKATVNRFTPLMFQSEPASARQHLREQAEAELALAHAVLVFEAGCVSNVKPPTHSVFHIT